MSIIDPPVIDPPTIEHPQSREDQKILAEILIGDPHIRSLLGTFGFTQFSPSTLEFSLDTKDLAQGALTVEGEEEKRAAYYKGLSPEDKATLDYEREQYRRTVEFVEKQITLAVSIIQANRFCIGDLLKSRLRKESLDYMTIKDVAEQSGINVVEESEQLEAYYRDGNHGIARYSEENNSWKIKLNKDGIGNVPEILHELTAISVFDSMPNPSFPKKLRILLTPDSRRHIRYLTKIEEISYTEATKRVIYSGNNMLSIEIIDILFDLAAGDSDINIWNELREYILNLISRTTNLKES